MKPITTKLYAVLSLTLLTASSYPELLASKDNDLGGYDENRLSTSRVLSSSEKKNEDIIQQVRENCLRQRTLEEKISGLGTTSGSMAYTLLKLKFEEELSALQLEQSLLHETWRKRHISEDLWNQVFNTTNKKPVGVVSASRSPRVISFSQPMPEERLNTGWPLPRPSRSTIIASPEPKKSASQSSKAQSKATVSAQAQNIDDFLLSNPFGAASSSSHTHEDAEFQRALEESRLLAEASKARVTEEDEMAMVLEESRRMALAQLERSGIDLSTIDTNDTDLIEALLASQAQENKKIREEQDREYEESLRVDRMRHIIHELKVLESEIEELAQHRLNLEKPIEEFEEKIQSIKRLKGYDEERAEKFGMNPKLEKSIREKSDQIEQLEKEFEEMIAHIQKEQKAITEEILSRQAHTDKLQLMIDEINYSS